MQYFLSFFLVQPSPCATRPSKNHQTEIEYNRERKEDKGKDGDMRQIQSPLIRSNRFAKRKRVQKGVKRRPFAEPE